MACVSMYVFLGPCTASDFRVSLQGLIDTDDGFPRWKWVMCFLSGGHTYHRHTHRVCAYVKCNEWAWWNGVWAQPFKELLLMLCVGPSAFSGERSATPTHTLKHASCSFLSCDLHLQQDYPSHPLFLILSGPVLFFDNIQTSLIELCSDWDAHEQYCSSRWIFR